MDFKNLNKNLESINLKDGEVVYSQGEKSAVQVIRLLKSEEISGIRNKKVEIIRFDWRLHLRFFVCRWTPKQTSKSLKYTS